MRRQCKKFDRRLNTNIRYLYAEVTLTLRSSIGIRNMRWVEEAVTTPIFLLCDNSVKTVQTAKILPKSMTKINLYFLESFQLQGDFV